MDDDPIIAEVRRVREALWLEANRASTAWASWRVKEQRAYLILARELKMRSNCIRVPTNRAAPLRLCGKNRLPIDRSNPRVTQIVHGRRGITADTALRLARYFVTRPGWWLDLQSHHDLEMAADKFEARIARTVKPCSLPAMARAS